MAYTEDEGLKVVLNVRDIRYTSLLEQVKDNTGINYQNLIKLGVLFLFQEEQRRISAYKKELAGEIQQQQPEQPAVPQEQMREQAGELIKVHITFVGKMKDTIEAWKYKKRLSPHDIARLGLEKVYQFFTRDVETQRPFVQEEKKTVAVKKATKSKVETKQKETIMTFLEGNSALDKFLDEAESKITQARKNDDKKSNNGNER